MKDYDVEENVSHLCALQRRLGGISNLGVKKINIREVETNGKKHISSHSLTQPHTHSHIQYTLTHIQYTHKNTLTTHNTHTHSQHTYTYNTHTQHTHSTHTAHTHTHTHSQHTHSTHAHLTQTWPPPTPARNAQATSSARRHCPS